MIRLGWRICSKIQWSHWCQSYVPGIGDPLKGALEIVLALNDYFLGFSHGPSFLLVSMPDAAIRFLSVKSLLDHVKTIQIHGSTSSILLVIVIVFASNLMFED